jgi:hypothetical protein
VGVPAFDQPSSGAKALRDADPTLPDKPPAATLPNWLGLFKPTV